MKKVLFVKTKLAKLTALLLAAILAVSPSVTSFAGTDVEGIIKEQTEHEKGTPSIASYESTPSNAGEKGLSDIKTDGEITVLRTMVQGSPIEVTVSAPAGTLPKGAYIRAKLVLQSDVLKEVDAAVSESKEEGVGTYGQYVMDITLYDADGNEIQPDGPVNISFGFIAPEFETAEELKVFHIEGEDRELTASNIEVTEEIPQAEEIKTQVGGETEGFSIYVLTFKINDKSYQLDGGDTVSSTDLLTALGYSSTDISSVTNIVSSDQQFVKVTKKTGYWDIEATIDRLNSSPKLFIIMGGITYVIPVSISGKGSFADMLDLQDDRTTDHPLVPTLQTKLYLINGNSRSEVTPTANNYAVTSGKDYILSLKFDSVKKGLVPGSYTYDWFSGKTFAGKTLSQWASLAGYDLSRSGDVIISSSGIMIGSFITDKDAKFIFFINENACFYQEVSGTIEIGLKFGVESTLATLDIKKTGTFDEATGKYSFSLECSVPKTSGKHKWIKISDKLYKPIECSVFTSISSGSRFIIKDVLFKPEGGAEVSIPRFNPKVAGFGVSTTDEHAYYVDDLNGNIYLLSKNTSCSDLNCDYPYTGTPAGCKSLSDLLGPTKMLPADASASKWSACWESDKDAKITIEYSLTQSIDFMQQSLDKDKKSVENEATITAFNSDGSVKASALCSIGLPDLISKAIIDKAGDSNGAVATYQLTVNSPFFDGTETKCINLADHCDASNKFYIGDQISGAEYVPGSLVCTVYKADGEEFVPPVSDHFSVEAYTEGTELKIVLTNPKAYMYKFTYQVKKNNPGANGSYTNAAYFDLKYLNSFGEGLRVAATTADSYINNYYFDASTNKIRVHKTNKANVPEMLRDLNDTEYTLYTFDGSKDIDLATAPKTAVGVTGNINPKITGTDELNGADGWYTFIPDNTEGLNLVRGYVYCLVETVAPSGYDLDEEKTGRYWFYYYKDNADNSTAAITKFNASGYKTETLHGFDIATTASKNVVFEHKDAPKPQKVRLSVGKDFSTADKPTVTTDYTFEIQAITADAPMPASSIVTLNYSGSPVQNSFGDMTYTTEGEWQYKIFERLGSVLGVEYTEDYYIFDVKVEVNQSTGITEVTRKLTHYDGNGAVLGSPDVAVVGEPEQCAEFKNKFTKKTYLYLTVNKNVIGNSRTTGSVFTFKLAGKEGAPMPASDTVTITDAGGTTQTPVTFGKITFDNAGTYNYTLTESGPETDGWALDSNRTREVKVVVSATPEGVLYIDDSSSGFTKTGVITGGVAYTNTFIKPAETIFKINKKVTGSSRSLGKIFTFKLEAKNGAPMPAGDDSVSITDNGTEDQNPAFFGEIKYTEPGTYEYTLTESGPSSGGWKLDPDPTRELKVVIVRNADDELVIDGSSTGFTVTGKYTGEVSFTNKYTYTPPGGGGGGGGGGGHKDPPWTPTEEYDPEPKTGTGAPAPGPSSTGVVSPAQTASGPNSAGVVSPVNGQTGLTAWGQLIDPMGTISGKYKYYANGAGKPLNYPAAGGMYSYIYATNPNFRGILTYAGKAMHVMQDPLNPEFYLTKDINGVENGNGEVFMAASSTLYDNNVLLYGHNKLDGSQFGMLPNYKDARFFKRNPNIVFQNILGDDVYEIISVFYEKIYKQNETNCFRYYSYYGELSEARFNEYVAQVKALSIYDTGKTAVYGDKLLTLSTCSYHTDNGRFVVVARKKK